MNRTASEIARLVEQALQKLKLPASQIVNQLAGTQVAPATSSTRGAVKLSDATPQPVGTAAAGTGATVSRSDHIHAQQSHNHTSASNDGGVLTNDAHDGYSDYTEISAPATPAANAARLYAKDKSGVAELFYKNDGGTERDLSTIGTVQVEETDGSPSGAVTLIKFPAGTLGIVGSTATYTPTGGSSGNVTDTGALGSEPGTPASGDLYLPNNSYAVERYSGSAWAPWGPIYPLTTPPLSGWSWVNQGSATVDTTNGGIYLTEPGRTSGTNFRCYVRTLPSAPYTITVRVRGVILAKNYHAFGLLWRQSSDGKCVFAYQQYNSGSNANNARFGVDKFTDASTFSAEYTSHGIPELFCWLRLRDNNTNRYVEYSGDGQHWHTLHSVGRTDFLTADQAGIFVSGENAATPNLDAGMLLESWKEA